MYSLPVAKKSAPCSSTCRRLASHVSEICSEVSRLMIFSSCTSKSIKNFFALEISSRPFKQPPMNQRQFLYLIAASGRVAKATRGIFFLPTARNFSLPSATIAMRFTLFNFRKVSSNASRFKMISTTSILSTTSPQYL